MIQFSIIRTLDGGSYCGRQVDAVSHSQRDRKYGHVDLPEFECELLEDGILNDSLTDDQMDLLAQLSLPLFPEKRSGATEGEDWKNA